MASTPSHRLRLTSSGSPHLIRTSRPARPLFDSCLSLRRVIGTTCTSPTGFDTVNSSFAYVAGGAVVLVDVDASEPAIKYTQRFYRARPSAVPAFAVSPVTHSSSLTPNSTPKANDSRNRTPRESPYGLGLPGTGGGGGSSYGGGGGGGGGGGSSGDWSDATPTSKTWTSRERIKAATCLALSRDGRLLAVGETGYAPRVLIFCLQDASSHNTPLVSISEHAFGVKVVAWSADTKYLASLGSANDGVLYLWRVDPRTGATKLFQQNRCTANVRAMAWMGADLITLGTRHIKVWRVEEEAPAGSPAKPRYPGDGSFAPLQSAQKPLPGRNILLGSMLEATFTCAVAIGEDKAIICSESGGVCLLDDSNKQMKLCKVMDLDLSISCACKRGDQLFVGSRDGQVVVLGIASILDSDSEPTVMHRSQSAGGFLAMGTLMHGKNLVAIDSNRSISVWDPGREPLGFLQGEAAVTILGPADPISGIQQLSTPNVHGAAFFTWSASGKVHIWDMDGLVRLSFDIPLEPVDADFGPEPGNQLTVLRATDDGSLFVAGDRVGVLRVLEYSTKQCLMETKAHASDCQDVTIYENKSLFLIASCGRDRTAQLFHKTSTGTFKHFQTLESSAKVVRVLIPADDKILTCSLDRTLQVFDLVAKVGEPDVMAAIQSRIISLRASPSSMVVTPDRKTIYVSLLDRNVCHYDLASGRLLNTFRCNDEGGMESVVLESLIYGQSSTGEMNFLVSISNTDKSIRVYEPSGHFMDREWGHTEAVNGVIVLGDDDEASRRVVSVGEDGTIMIWALDLQSAVAGSAMREASPEKGGPSLSSRPPLRRVLSKAELAEFQRPPSSYATVGARSLNRRTSKFSLSTLRTPVAGGKHGSGGGSSPVGLIAEDNAATPSARRASVASGSAGGASSSSRSGSPPLPASPKHRLRTMSRRPSLPALNARATASAATGLLPGRSGSAMPTMPTTTTITTTARKRTSMANLRGGGGGGGGGYGGGYGFGSLSMATEQTCRHLRAYRKKLSAPCHAAADNGMINTDVLAELDAELRLTAAALGERAIRTRSTAAAAAAAAASARTTDGNNGGGSSSDTNSGANTEVNESMLSSLLDQYSKQLVSMLDQRFKLRREGDGAETPGQEGGKNESGGDGSDRVSRGGDSGRQSAASLNTTSGEGETEEEADEEEEDEEEEEEEEEEDRPRTAGAGSSIATTATASTTSSDSVGERTLVRERSPSPET